MNFNINTIWFDVALITFTFLCGHIVFAVFELHTKRWRKFLKFFITLFIVLTLIHFFGRTVAYTVYGIAFLPVIYIHAIWLPKKGVNGWTAEPKETYYKLRGWDKK